MRTIRKGPEPHVLKTHRTSEGATFDNLSADTKTKLRERLAQDQGYLCCYCMTGIDPLPRPSGQIDVKIEHWAPQSAFPERALDFRNLLAACPGNQGSPPSQQHCDTRKADASISLDPVAPSAHPGLLRYQADGTIDVDDPVLRADLNDRLNLNTPQLVSNRKEVIRWFQQELIREMGSDKTWSKARLAGQIERLQKPGPGGRLPPYVETILYWLRKRLG
jgi:uncharacterized protein (TIGR02646 family)